MTATSAMADKLAALQSSFEGSQATLTALQVAHAAVVERARELEVENVAQRAELGVLRREVSDMSVAQLEHDSIRRRLFNVIQDLRGNIRVFCRVRPMLPQERKDAKINTSPFDSNQGLINCVPWNHR